jgi:hypothetical protein
VLLALDGGSDRNITGAEAAQSPYTAAVTMVNPHHVDSATHMYYAAVTDARGNMRQASGGYTVGPTVAPPPRIDDAQYADNVLAVTVSDNDPAAQLTVSASAPPGMRVEPASVTLIGAGEAVFFYSAEDLLAGGAGGAEITVDDGWGGVTTDSLTTSCAPLTIPPGALAAVPLKSTVAVGAEAPFRSMNAVRLLINYGAQFVDESLNVGAPGGAEYDSDGIWAQMTPIPDAFSLPIVRFAVAPTYGADFLYCDFRVLPNDGSDLTSGGLLFNFAVTCTEPGEYTLLFQEIQIHLFTLYRDGERNVYRWSDLSNDYPGVPNSFTVTEE